MTSVHKNLTTEWGNCTRSAPRTPVTANFKYTENPPIHYNGLVENISISLRADVPRMLQILDKNSKANHARSHSVFSARVNKLQHRPKYKPFKTAREYREHFLDEKNPETVKLKSNLISTENQQPQKTLKP